MSGFNNNLMGGKRRHKNIAKYGHMTLVQRLVAESKALDDYHKRVGQGNYNPKNKTNGH